MPRVRVVSYDPAKPYNFGFNLENYGVPDIRVRNTPDEEIRRFDRELLRAVQEAVRLLESGGRRWLYNENGGRTP